LTFIPFKWYSFQAGHTTNDTRAYEWAPVSFFRNCVTSNVQKALDDTNAEGKSAGAFPEEKYQIQILGNGVGVDINLNHKKQ